ncbi:MAG: hypothetical protein ABI481_08515 [Pyrinomonadaceae bacterium]
MLSVMADGSKDVFESVLAGGGGDKAVEKFSLLDRKVGEFNSEAKAIEDISDLPADLHTLAVRG